MQALRAGSFFVAEFIGAAVSVFPLLAGPGSRTAVVCSHSALVSTRPIVCTCKYTFVLLVPKPRLFRSQRARTDNVRKASVPPALFDRACLEERSPERSSQPLCALTGLLLTRSSPWLQAEVGEPVGSAPSQGPVQHRSRPWKGGSREQHPWPAERGEEVTGPWALAGAHPKGSLGAGSF